MPQPAKRSSDGMRVADMGEDGLGERGLGGGRSLHEAPRRRQQRRLADGGAPAAG